MYGGKFIQMINFPPREQFTTKGKEGYLKMSWKENSEFFTGYIFFDHNVVASAIETIDQTISTGGNAYNTIVSKLIDGKISLIEVYIGKHDKKELSFKPIELFLQPKQDWIQKYLEN